MIFHDQANVMSVLLFNHADQMRAKHKLDVRPWTKDTHSPQSSQITNNDENTLKQMSTPTWSINERTQEGIFFELQRAVRPHHHQSWTKEEEQ